jgi:AsmA protein
MELAVRSVRIADGRFTFVRGGARPQVFEDIDIELRNVSTTSAIEFALEAKRTAGGRITVEGRAGPLAFAGAELPPVEAKFTVPPLDLNASLVDRATGVAGTAAFDGALRTKGNIVEMTGNLRAEKLKLVAGGSPATRPLDMAFAVSHDVVRRAGRLNRADIQIGQAASNLTGTYTLAGDTPAFALRLRGEKMPLTELTGMLPALDVELPAGSTIEAGTLTIRADVAGALGRFSVVGPVSLDNVKLANFDLGVKLRAIQLLAGLPTSPATEIQKLSGRVKRMPEGTRIENIVMVVPTIGELSGAGTVSARKELDFRMQATLHTSGELMRALGQTGDTTVPFLVTGTASDPRFRADVRAIAGEKLRGLTKDPEKTVKAARDLLELFRRPKREKEGQPKQ